MIMLAPGDREAQKDADYKAYEASYNSRSQARLRSRCCSRLSGLRSCLCSRLAGLRCCLGCLRACLGGCLHFLVSPQII
jgi:hypothetical protein